MTLLTVRALLRDDNETTASLPLFLEKFSAVVEESNKRHKYNQFRVIACIQCQHVLAHQHNVFLSEDWKFLNKQLASFRSKFMDPFWNGYRAVHESTDMSSMDSILPESVVMEPVEWMLEQWIGVNGDSDCVQRCSLEGDTTKPQLHSSLLEDREQFTKIEHSSLSPSLRDKSPLHCPHCRVECGYIRSSCLPICLDYLLVDFFVLNKDCIKYKRLLPNR